MSCTRSMTQCVLTPWGLRTSTRFGRPTRISRQMDRRAVLESVAVGPRLILITHPWMLQFGGHHLTLNIAIAVRQGALTPTLTGAQPAAFKLNVKTIRPREESSKALALLRSLDEKQRGQAVLHTLHTLLRTLCWSPVRTIRRSLPRGLKALRRTSHGGRTLGFDRRMGRHHLQKFCRLPHGSDEGGAELDVHGAARRPAELEAMALRAIAFRVRASS